MKNTLNIFKSLLIFYKSDFSASYIYILSEDIIINEGQNKWKILYIEKNKENFSKKNIWTQNKMLWWDKPNSIRHVSVYIRFVTERISLFYLKAICVYRKKSIFQTITTYQRAKKVNPWRKNNKSFNNLENLMCGLYFQFQPYKYFKYMLWEKT